MDDFDRRLALRLASYEESAPAPTTPREPASPVGRIAAPRSRPSRWMLFVPAAAVVVIGAVFGVVGSGLLSGVRPVGNGPVTSLEWTTHPFVPGARVVALTAVGYRLIATGSLNNKAAAWYSDDGGETWTAAEVEPSARIPGVVATQALADVAERAGRLVALDAYTVGFAEGEPTSTTIHTNTWLSADRGASWRTAPGIDGSGGSLTATPDGFMTLGVGPNGTGDSRISADGVSWDKVDLVGIDKRAELADAASNGSTVFVVGSVPPLDQTRGVSVPMIWESSKGGKWTGTRLGQESTGIPWKVVIGADGPVVVGGAISAGDQDPSQRPVVWTTTGRGSWNERFLPPGSTDAHVAAATSVASNNLGTVVGVRRSATDNSPADQLWFIPSTQPELANEQGLNRQVAAIASLKDRFVAISQCDANGNCMAPTVNIGKGSNEATVASTATPTLAVSPEPSPTASPPRQPSPVATGHPVGPTQQPSIPGLVFVAPGEIGSVISVATSSNGWVAVGTANGHPGIWHSDDGTAWQLVGSLPAIPNTPSDAPVTVHDVVATATGFLAVGSVSTAVDYSRPFAWFSANGTSWTSAELPGSDGCGSVQGLVKTRSSQLVAVGRTCGHSQAGSTETDAAAIWLSDGGTSWRTASVADAVGGAIDDIAETADGFVAVGSVRNGSSNRPRVWESSDGEKWEATWTDARAGALNSVTTLDKMVVAGGVLGDNTTQLLPRMWVRTARDEWATRAVAGGQCCGVIESVTAAGGELVALDQAFIFDGTDRRTLVLTSRDGAAWHQVELANSFVGSALSIAPDGRVVALGSALSEGDVPAPAILAVPNPESAKPLARDAAIAAARAFAGVDAETPIISAEYGPFAQFEPDPNEKNSPPSPDHLVWHVAFGSVHSLTVSVILDFYSSELIELTAGIQN